MLLNVLLWLLIWGGVFTGIVSIPPISLLLSQPLTFLQGIRAFFPIIALYIVVIWILASRPRFPFYRNPLRFLLLYCTVGLVVSFFLSPDITTSLYWGGLYLSPILVMWIVLERPDVLASLRVIININFSISVLISFALLPGVTRGPGIDLGREQFYSLPLGLGIMRANGVGRFALIVIIFSSAKLLFSKGKSRYLFLGLIFPSLYLLARSQSRTALLGLAVCSVLIVIIKQLDWRLVFIAPFVVYVIWISGIVWRAKGSFDNLLDLSGRQMTWERGLELIKQSPFLGWGFHADRLLLHSEHMHNSYLHSLIHSGILGTAAFILAFIGTWIIIFKKETFSSVQKGRGPNQVILVGSILILGFLTARGFFESTGAFYGVDLLLIVPSMTFIAVWAMDYFEEGS